MNFHQLQGKTDAPVLWFHSFGGSCKKAWGFQRNWNWNDLLDLSTCNFCERMVLQRVMVGNDHFLLCWLVMKYGILLTHTLYSKKSYWLEYSTNIELKIFQNLFIWKGGILSTIMIACTHREWNKLFRRNSGAITGHERVICPCLFRCLIRAMQGNISLRQISCTLNLLLGDQQTRNINSTVVFKHIPIFQIAKVQLDLHFNDVSSMVDIIRYICD